MDGGAIFRPLTMVHKVDLGLNSVLSKLHLLISQCQLHQRLFSYMFNGQGSSITVISTSGLRLSLQYAVISSYHINPI